MLLHRSVESPRTCSEEACVSSPNRRACVQFLTDMAWQWGADAAATAPRCTSLFETDPQPEVHNVVFLYELGVVLVTVDVVSLILFILFWGVWVYSLHMKIGAKQLTFHIKLETTTEKLA